MVRRNTKFEVRNKILGASKKLLRMEDINLEQKDDIRGIFKYECVQMIG